MNLRSIITNFRNPAFLVAPSNISTRFALSFPWPSAPSLFSSHHLNFASTSASLHNFQMASIVLVELFHEHFLYIYLLYKIYQVHLAPISKILMPKTIPMLGRTRSYLLSAQNFSILVDIYTARSAFIYFWFEKQIE